MTDPIEFVVQVSWGVRPVSIEDLTLRLSASLRALEALGGDLAGPWLADYERPVTSRDTDAVRAVIEASPVRDEYGTPHPEEGYNPSLVIGNWNRSTGLGKLGVYAGVGSSLSGVTMTFEGKVLAEQVRTHARALVEGFCRCWQPDLVALTDMQLLNERRKRLPPPAPGRTFAPWGYHAWLSDRHARHLDTVDGAISTRFGPGTLLITESWDPVTTAQTWQTLLGGRRIRGIRIREAQEALPQF